MGNGISHAQLPAKEKEILVDDSPTAQFHRVLVEPEYCLPGPPTNSDDKQNTSVVTEGINTDLTVTDTDRPGPVADGKLAKRVDASYFSADIDYAVIPDEEEEVVSKHTDTDLQQSHDINIIAEQDIQISKIHEENSDEKQTLLPLNSAKLTEQSKEKTHLFVENINVPEKSETTTKAAIEEAPNKRKTESQKKESKSVFSMFKFSKHKPKVVAEFVPEVNADKENEKTLSNDVKNKDSLAKSELIDSLKGTSVDEAETVALIVDNAKNILIQKTETNPSDKCEVLPNEIHSSSNQSDGTNLKTQTNVERLNSLDSGIVVDKISESSQNGQHIQHNGVDVQENVTNGSNKAESIKEVTVLSLKSPNPEIVKVTDDQHNETEANNINNELVTDGKECLAETAVFKSGKEHKISSSKENGNSGVTEELESYEPLEIPGQEITYSPLEEKDIKTEESGKSKKKSWSFQFGGNKKNSNSSDKLTTSTTSVDKLSSSVKKKSKSIWGKLSFKKSTDDVSMDTAGDTLYENEKSEPKKKNKLKKIKAKKEKKASLKKKIEESDDGETFSNADSHLSEELNTPRSRRSIVEEETPLVQNDAFEGISVSDLSLDGDVQAAHNLNGKESYDSPFDRELKKSLAKRAEKLQSDDDQDTSTENTPSSTSNATNVEINVMEPSEDICNNSNDESALEAMPKSSFSAQDKEELIKDNEKHEKETADITDDYAHIVKEVPSIAKPIQQIEYANLHALPKTEPILEETNESKKDLIPDMEQTLDEKIKTVREDSLFDQSNGTETTEHASDNKELEKEIRDVHFQKQMNAKTELSVKDSDNFTTEKGSDETVFNHGDISPGGVSNTQDETDAYVHLVQLVQDYKDDKFDKHLIENNEKLITGTNSVMINLVPVSQESKLVSNSNSVSLNTQPTTKANRTEASTKEKRGVIILKEVGIQAPDIHIPMDIENDFGYSFRQGDLVDIGVQVSVNDLNDTECLSQENKLISPTVNIESVYF